MRISHFSVENFRSITKAYKLPLEDLTVIIGPNNEGKSNILAALNIALSTLMHGKGAPANPKRTAWKFGVIWRVPREWRYDWGRDFPVQLRQTRPEGTSRFAVEFELTPGELTAFNRAVGSQLSTALKLQVAYGNDNLASVEVLIQGPGKGGLNAALPRVLAFIQERTGFQYIPSIRDMRLAQGVVDDLVAQELAQLDQDQQYRKTIAALHALQLPLLQRLGDELQKTLSEFIPDVRKVRLDTQGELYEAVSRSSKIHIDDGTETELLLKGDGIKSLAAIALMRYAASQPQSGRKRAHLVLAVEEPEVHLHPRAIRTLRPVLVEIARSAQVIISTHSPLLADAERPRRNILVSASKATPAKSIEQVRDLLGVELGDNLRSANLVLLVEGESDRRILSVWLSGLSADLKRAIAQRQLVIEGIGGASKLCAHLSTYRASACATHVFFDDDAEARTHIAAAIARNLVSMSEVHQTVCQGMGEAELEDLVSLSAYRGELETNYGIALSGADFRNSGGKWSERLKATMKRQGKPWGERIEETAKSLVADCVEANPKSLNSHRASPIEALKNALQSRLSATFPPTGLGGP